MGQFGLPAPTAKNQYLESHVIFLGNSSAVQEFCTLSIQVKQSKDRKTLIPVSAQKAGQKFSLGSLCRKLWSIGGDKDPPLRLQPGI